MNVITILTTAFGIIGFIGGAVGYFAKARGDSIISYQAKEITALQSYNRTLESEKLAAETERDSLKQQNKTLTGLAQGSPQLAELTEQIKKLVSLMQKGQRK